MSMQMVQEGHVVHASAMFNEKYHLAWGDLGVGYVDPWTIGDTPPDAITRAVEEQVLRLSGDVDQLLHSQIATGGVKIVFQGGTWDNPTTLFIEGTDYQVLDNGRIDWSLMGNSPATDSTYSVVYRFFDDNQVSLINEVGRREATITSYVKEDIYGDIVANEKKWSIVTQEEFQQTDIQFTSGSTITSGQYFFLSDVGTDFYIWYQVDSAGTDPLLAGKTSVMVDVLSTDTAETIASKTQIQLDALPNFTATVDDVDLTLIHIENTQAAEVSDSYNVDTPFSVTVINQGTRYPTRNLYIQFKFEATDAQDKDIYQLGLFLNTQPDSDTPVGQQYLTSTDLDGDGNPGQLYMLENIEPFPRAPGKREIFEFVIIF